VSAYSEPQVAPPVVIGVRWTPHRLRALRHGLWLAAAFGLLYVVGLVLADGVGLDAHAYWAAWRHQHLYSAAPQQRDAYLYSPAFAEAIWPLTLLPWPLFWLVWTAATAAAYTWLLWPLGRRWALPLLLLCTPDMVMGNVGSFFALVAVLGFTMPALWAFPLLLKVTPGVGVVWFAARREYRSLLLALASTSAIAAVSLAAAPTLWYAWIRLLLHPQRFADGTRAALHPVLQVPTGIHLVVGLSAAVLLTAHAARTNRRHLLAPAMLLAAPVWGLNALGVLAAMPRLARAGGSRSSRRLRRMTYSRAMRADDVQRLQAVGSEAEIPAGHVLIEPGQTGTGLYVILEGTVVVEAPEGSRELGPQTLVGERALVSPDGVRTARVRARTDLRVVAVDRHAFERLCAHDPEFARRVGEAGD
jgi:hypothetical protein